MLLSDYLANLRQLIEKFETYGFAESIDIRQEIRDAENNTRSK